MAGSRIARASRTGEARLIECPECGDTGIERALMAPARGEAAGVDGGAGSVAAGRCAAGGGTGRYT